MKKRMICGLTSCRPMLLKSSTASRMKRPLCGRMYFASRSQYCWNGIFKQAPESLLIYMWFMELCVTGQQTQTPQLSHR